MVPPASQSRRSGRSGAGTHPSRKRANTMLIENAQGPNNSSSTKRRRPTPTLEVQQQEKEEEVGVVEEAVEAEEEEEEEDNFINEGIDDDAEEPHWRGSWKATVNRKFDLSRSQLGIWTAGSLSEDRLTEWRLASKYAYKGPLQLTYSWLEAIVTHEKARAKADTASMDLMDGEQLEEVYRTLRKYIEQGKQPILNLVCHFDGVEPPPPTLPSSTQISSQMPIRTQRQTATVQQVTALPEVLQNEAVTGNAGPAIAQIWVCRSSQCTNIGAICWVKGSVLRDNPKNHFPISSELMRRWSKEIKEGNSTPEEPSSRLAAEFAEEKATRQARAKGSNASAASKTAGSTNTERLMDKYMQMKLLRLFEKEEVPTPSPRLGSSSGIQALPAPSSPVHSVSDPADIMRQFFEWYIEHHGGGQREALLEICDKLIDEDWSLDYIRSESKGGGMTATDWQGYGFKLGTLAKIRGRISEFKRWRDCSNSSASSAHISSEDEV